MDKRVTGSGTVVEVESPEKLMLPIALFSWTAASRKAAGVFWIALGLILAWRPAAAAGTGKDAYEVLLEAGLSSDLKQGYSLRADSWGGDLPADGSKRVEHTLLRGNDYRFIAYTTTKGAKISFHVQDREGAVIEMRSWQKEKDNVYFAGADITPKETGSYYLVVKVEQSPSDRTEWLLVYAYK